MKWLLYLFIFSIVVVSPVYGQAPKVSVKGGLNVSSFSGSDFEPAFGYHFGITGYHQLSENIYLSPEMTLSLLGGKSPFSTIRLQYVQMPILIKYKTNNIYFTAGPQFGLLIQGRETYSETDRKEKITAYFKNPDISLALGLGMNFTEKFGAECRYSHGLKNISSTFVNSGLNNRLLQVSLVHIIK